LCELFDLNKFEIYQSILAHNDELQVVVSFAIFVCLYSYHAITKSQIDYEGWRMLIIADLKILMITKIVKLQTNHT